MRTFLVRVQAEEQGPRRWAERRVAAQEPVRTQVEAIPTAALLEWGYGAIGSALALQARGSGFESPCLHVPSSGSRGPMNVFRDLEDLEPGTRHRDGWRSGAPGRPLPNQCTGVLGLSVQQGVDAPLSRGRSRVRVPYGPRNVAARQSDTQSRDSPYRPATPRPAMSLPGQARAFWTCGAMAAQAVYTRQVGGSSPSRSTVSVAKRSNAPGCDPGHRGFESLQTPGS